MAIVFYLIHGVDSGEVCNTEKQLGSTEGDWNIAGSRLRNYLLRLGSLLHLALDDV